MNGISVLRMDWIQDNNWLINAGTNSLSFIEAKSEKVVQEVGLDGGIPLSMSIADQRVYILLNDSIKVVDIGSFTIVKTISPIPGGTMSIAASADGKLLALGISDNKTQLINPEDGSVVRNLKSNYGGWAVAFSPDSQFIFSGTSQGILKWETASGIFKFVNGGQDKTVKSLVFSNDGKTIAGGGDGFIYFWDVESGDLIHRVEEAQFGVVNNLDFSPDDSMLVSGSADNIVRIWNVDTAALLKELTGHSSQIFGVCFSPDGEYIASGANEGTIRIWGLP
jgi:WD40 repeat protein